MPKFLYQVKTTNGQMQTGQADAVDEVELKVKLKAKGLIAVRIVQVGGRKEAQTSFFAKRVDSRELQIYTRQFSTLINAGIPIIDSLKILSDGKRNEMLKTTTKKVIQSLEGGRRLGDSMAAFPEVFDRLYVNMVRAGEEAGILDGILNRMAIYLEKSEKLKKQIKSAMMYPLVIIIISGLVITAILVFIIPKFQDLYKQSKKELPGLTQMVVDASQFLIHKWYIVIGLIVIIPYAGMMFYRSPEGKDMIDRWLIRAPIFGELIQKASVARMTRTLATLLAAGVGVIEAIDIAARTSGNRVIEEALIRCKESVTAGKAFAAPLTREKMIPEMVTQMVAIGEQSGTLDTMLGKIADFYEDDVEAVVKAVTTLIEPMLMVFLGGAIAFLIIAMYLPIFDMANTTPG